jgi:hypothetical protein
MGKASVLFEPLNLSDVPEAAAAGFDWSTYRLPGTPWPEGEAYLSAVFEGRIVNEWTARELSLAGAIRSDRLIVKFVRANRLLPWLCERFELPAPILLFRHPCAVVASQLRYGWNNIIRPSCPGFLDDYPAFRASLAATDSREAYLAASWCLEYLPALLAPAPVPWMVLTYEELLLRPKATLDTIASHWNLRFDMTQVIKRLQTPSSTVSSTGIAGVNGWQRTLSPAQVSRILATTHAFGLSFYDTHHEPDYASLRCPGLSDRLASMGLSCAE